MLPSPAEVRAQWSEQRPDLDTSAMEVVARLKQVTALIDRETAPLYEGAALTASEVDLLVPLRYAPEPVIARSLAEHKGYSRAGISKALAKLEKRDLVARERNPADRRAALVRITEEGKRAIDSVFPRQVSIEAGLLVGLGDDRLRIVEALDRLAEVIAASPHASGSNG